MQDDHPIVKDLDKFRLVDDQDNEIKEIYVYFSDIDFTNEFIKHPDFIALNEYNIKERALCINEEIGKLSLKNGMQIRLIYDAGIEKACPWCGFTKTEIIIEEITIGDITIGDITRFFAQCLKCLARGPILNVYPHLLYNQTSIDEFKEIVRQRWACRIPKVVKLPKQLKDMEI